MNGRSVAGGVFCGQPDRTWSSCERRFPFAVPALEGFPRLPGRRGVGAGDDRCQAGEASEHAAHVVARQVAGRHHPVQDALHLVQSVVRPGLLLAASLDRREGTHHFRDRSAEPDQELRLFLEVLRIGPDPRVG